MPDKNAAAQRVLSIAKSLRLAKFEVLFYGLSASGDLKGQVDGFQYEACSYPVGTKRWFKYVLGIGIIDYIRQINPDIIILYNYPAFAQERIIWYCRKKSIKTIGDITEWYRPLSLIKWLDTWLRMHVSNRHLDGVIAISKYLAEYYKDMNMIQVPPLVDITEKKWEVVLRERTDDLVHLVYIGTGLRKDKLGLIVEGIIYSNPERFYLDVIGITKERFIEMYNLEVDNLNIKFHGRLSHKEALVYLKNSDFQIFFRDSDNRTYKAGFPTKFAETITAGIPVITNRFSNVSDYIVNGNNGFFVDNLSQNRVIEVLKTVSKLKKDDIDRIKQNINVNEFDYHGYVGKICSFIESIF